MEHIQPHHPHFPNPVPADRHLREMCGITGFINPAMIGDRQGLLTTSESMANTLNHRGPDGSGTFADAQSGVALAHRRLAIIDLTDCGAQPMRSVDGRLTITFNGEIYNFQEIRTELETAGGSFLPWRSSSDTEVMLAAIQVWGLETALSRFVGMFAFALWDQDQRVLHLARDRMGEKPLYYGRTGNSLVFGSELKALRAYPGFSPELDMEALSLYLRFQYIPEPRSIYKDVAKLSPGHLLTVRADALHDLNPVPYWTLKETVITAQATPFSGTEAEAADQLEALLRSSVRNQMLADVPLGALLSGGIDSSLITALMQQESCRPIRSFTIGFDDVAYDESASARQIAAHIGTDHTELFVTPDHVLDLVETLPDLYDEPFSDASQLPTHLVAQMTRNHVTVCLTGDGGDETFAGYNRHFWAPAIWNKISRFPTSLRSLTARALQQISPGNYETLFSALGHLLPKASRVSTPGHKLHKLADILSMESREALYKQLCSTWPAPAKLLGIPEPFTDIDQPDSWPPFADYTRQMQYLDTITYLTGDILHKVDRATMGVSLESRAPYLDHRVIEFAWRLPVSMLIREKQGKHILRTILDRSVPKELMDRPKMGFGIPIDKWLRGPLKEWAYSLLDPTRLRRQGMLDVALITRQLDEHMNGQRDNQYRLWNILMLQSWLDRWMH